MRTILYNPLSSKGKNIKLAQKLAKKYTKQGLKVETIDLLTITNVKVFLDGFNEEDEIIILGGDGTLHRIVNEIEGLEIRPKVYLYKAGTGNDFIRTVPVKNHLADIKPYIKDLPTLYIGEKRLKVINGAGVGLDGAVIFRVDKSKRERNKSNYFFNTVASFIKYQPVAAKITVDGKVYEEKKLWFASAMFAQYFGGGMKIAPTKSRDQKEIELVIVKNIPRFVLLLIFPSIYMNGAHRIFKRWVKFYRGKDIRVEMTKPSFLQADGECHYPVDGYQIKMEA
ncbi:diacylglycerol/lipid kinase family protein [Acholeplasma hippikon]|uniref:Diacylglycerol kinase n=1 Tax=Acholeplasma hippikon TaxID=264636 RepID=A0A449BL77_9MOLU|nr:diacylglycerol kinase family protein [Acholeplasma hippikon]VEU83199.1 Diacylglycerol kinase [Acholeplasma hippikon]